MSNATARLYPAAADRHPGVILPIHHPSTLPQPEPQSISRSGEAICTADVNYASTYKHRHAEALGGTLLQSDLQFSCMGLQ